MGSDHFVFSIVKLCVRRFESPAESAGRSGLTGVNLRSGSMREKNNLLARWGLNRVRHVRGRFFRRIGLGVSNLAFQNHEEDQPDHRRRRL